MTPEEAEEITRAIIINKLTDGDTLDRSEVETILNLLGKNMQYCQFAKDIAQHARLPERIKGYKVVGQGNKTGSKKTGLYAQIAADYHNLLEQYSPAEALEILERESRERYERKYTYKSIQGFITRGRKIP